MYIFLMHNYGSIYTSDGGFINIFTYIYLDLSVVIYVNADLFSIPKATLSKTHFMDLSEV